MNHTLKSDTTLVQAACKYLNGAGIAIDGVWGQSTENAFNALRTTWNIECLNIRSNLTHTKFFLGMVIHCGLADYDANTISSTSC